MLIKIINAALICIACFMGLKQGYAMLTGKPQMLEMFSKWGFSANGLLINGILTMLAAVMILFHKTFLWGNFLMAAGILLIICFHFQDKDLKGVIIELPFLLLNLVIIWLQYPLKK